LLGRDRQEQADNLIAHLYDAALDTRLWIGVASRMAAVLDSPSTAILLLHRDKTADWLTRTDNFSERAAAEYDSYYYQHDIWISRARQLGLTRAHIYGSEDLITDEDMLRSEFYQDWSRKVGCFYVTGTIFGTAAGDSCIFGVHRSIGQEPYAREDKTIIARLIPHFDRALEVRHVLGRAAIEHQAALDVLEHTQVATLVLGRSGAILYANRIAEALLRAGDAISSVGSSLTVADHAASDRLLSCVRSAVDAAFRGRGNGGGTISLRRGERLPLYVVVAPFRAAREGFGPQAPAAILFIRDPEKPAPQTAMLQALFGLTATEASIAALLAGGRPIDSIAATHRISLNTARTHVKSVMAKTGTSRQAQFVALVLRATAAGR
jgi:DNA-binding CsgD family transcriptional regulator